MVLPLYSAERGTTPAIVNYALIAINVLVFVTLQGFGSNDEFTYAYAVVPYKIISGRNIATDDQKVEDPITGQEIIMPGLRRTPGGVYVTLLTSLFMHGGWAHILGNMWFLWIFGGGIEDRMGHGRYAIFYIVSGVFASLAHVASTAMFGQNEFIPSLGASGAISGVLGAYMLLYPTRPILVLLVRIVVTLPAFIVIGLWFVFQLVSGLGALGDGTRAGGVAYAAHVGGFVVGMVLVYPFLVGLPPPRRRYVYQDERW